MMEMAITRSTKELSTTTIDCGGSFDVILTLGAEPEITEDMLKQVQQYSDDPETADD